MTRMSIIALALLTAFAGRVSAQVAPPRDSALDARTAAVSAQLRCPVCQGESIQDSPAELAQQMRDLVRDQLRAGKSPDDIKAYFVSKYGEWILLQPKATGFNLVAYVLPVLVVLGGLVWIFFAVRRWTKPPDMPETPAAPGASA